MKPAFSKLKKIFRHNFKFYLPRSNKESIYFFTFHKCASTLFSRYVLKNIKGFHSIDYAKYLANKPNSHNKKLIFHEKGFIYGPIRLSAIQLEYSSLVVPTSKPDFIKDKTAIFFIRDPRDILVSAYYSFGFTHKLNPVEEKRREQLERRKLIQSLSVDEYSLMHADQQVEYFNRLKAVASNCDKKLILRYEDMIENFDLFISQFKEIVDIEDEVVRLFYEKSRPKKTVDNSSHRRSGMTKRYQEELKPNTIEVLNDKLQQILKDFKYGVDS